jgi:hypothetical protein
MELTLVGLQNSGKTTLVNVIAVRTPFFLARPNRAPPHSEWHARWLNRISLDLQFETKTAYN